MSRYVAAEIEPKWQAAWTEAEVFRARRTGDKPKYYVLEMFPYPSGRIHIGHVRNYTMGDVVARYKRATGHNVLHPMGFDAFGMPAENAAMANGGHPRDWTYANIDTMVEQGIRDDYIVLVGGAPLNEEFGKAIGADAYCRDAAVAVETAKEWVGRKHNAAKA